MSQLCSRRLFGLAVELQTWNDPLHPQALPYYRSIVTCVFRCPIIHSPRRLLRPALFIYLSNGQS